MTQKELEDYLLGAANILHGMIDAANFKQYIFPLLFFKRASDLWDEEYQTALKEKQKLSYLCRYHKTLLFIRNSNVLLGCLLEHFCFYLYISPIIVQLGKSKPSLGFK